ncbi:growth arrest and DNA-damage-inducible, beta b [Brachyhypopomus gauderio]|uniref:growth arrest and DNA-damage-inducible, beta b n=1 Tax=Brachyhypopomus gauderio TaxID=698409 RepID=UPI0040437D86
MTLEELLGCSSTDNTMENVSQSLEELLSAARRQNCLTVGVYESAKLMNVDPDNVVLCVLATDDGEEDVALQIHFTLIQAFCCDTRTDVVRVSGMRRLAQVLGEPPVSNANEPKDLHCILVTDPQAEHLKLNEVGRYCKESRCRNQWVPYIALQER